MVLEACECQRIHQIERANTADEHRWLRSLECLACVSVRKVMSARFAREFSKVCRVSRCSSGLYPDVMHILHLAVIPDAVASVFLEYTDDESIFSGSKRDDRLEELWQLYRSWCEDGQIAERAQRKLFSTAILKNNQYVEISQKVMNATACRYMIFFLAVLGEMALQKLRPQAGNFHYWIAGACWAFASMERIMLHGDRFLSRSDCERFYNDYLVMRGGYNHLAQRALSLQLPRWHCRPKLHQWEHTVMDYLPRNPRYYSNFLGEDFIRRAKALAVKSHPNWMARHVLLRYVLQFCLALRE